MLCMNRNKSFFFLLLFLSNSSNSIPLFEDVCVRMNKLRVRKKDAQTVVVEIILQQILRKKKKKREQRYS